MNADYRRPSARDMTFRLYGRPLHPELFTALACRQVRRDDYVLTVCITATGHVLTWQTGDLILAEVTAASDELLPRRGNLLQHRLQGERTGSLEPARGLLYHHSSQLEVLPPEIFVHVHDEIVADGGKRGLLYHHQPHHRMALSPIGFITVEAWQNTLSINAFHTFPEEGAIVKTQSLIERC